MNKICTSIEQSKKLIELGIDVNTSDMFWKNGFSNKRMQCFIPFVSDIDVDFDYDIPAWSLSALLKLMPRIEHIKPFIDLSPKLDSEEIAIYYHSEDSPYIVKDNLIDAAFEMVCWLLENKKL